MRLPRIAIACGLTLVTTCIAQVCSAEIPWRPDLTTAHAEATQANKPLLLHFYSDNCVWCDRLEAGAFQSPQVGEALAQGFVPVKIHAAKSPEIAKMFRVTKFPTDVVVTPSGQTLAHSVSPQDPNRYVAMLAQASTQMPVTASPQASMPQTRLAQQVPSPNGMNTATVTEAVPTQPIMNPHVPATTAAARTPSSPANMTLPGGATAQLAGSRTDGMTLGMPEQTHMAASIPSQPSIEDVATEPSASEVSSSQTKPAPKLAMDGYCAVTVIDEDRWAEGNPKFGVIHLGKLYLFESAAKMETFLKDPTPYTPVLNEIDVVRFFEERKIVRGKRQFGMKDPIHGRMFFFADEAAMNHFYNEYERYTDAAVQVMQQAVRDANPDAS